MAGKLEKMKSMSPASKAGDPSWKVVLIIQYLISFMFHVSIVVTVGIYLFNREEDTECWAPNNDDDIEDEDDYVDVSERFYNILCIFFAMCIAGCVQDILTLLGLFTGKLGLISCASLLCLNGCLEFAAFIIVTVYRF